MFSQTSRLNHKPFVLRIFRVLYTVQFSRYLMGDIGFTPTSERRRRDLNPRAATNDLLPFQGSPFSRLGTSACWILYIMKFFCSKRREWDSNPRALSDKRFSRPPRYDRFDISPNVLSHYKVCKLVCQVFFYIYFSININPTAAAPENGVCPVDVCRLLSFSSATTSLILSPFIRSVNCFFHNFSIFLLAPNFMTNVNVAAPLRLLYPPA